MKILNSIAYLMLSTAIIMSNNSYTSDSASTNSTNKFQGNSNKGNNNNNTHNNKYKGDYFQGTESELQELIKNLTIEEKQSNNNNNQVNTRDKIVHFKNESGDNYNLCSLASLNQCLSSLNPGNNQLLNDFMKKYNELYNTETLNNKPCYSSEIFSNLLEEKKGDSRKNILISEPDLDIVDRYNILLSLYPNLNDIIGIYTLNNSGMSKMTLIKSDVFTSINDLFLMIDENNTNTDFLNIVVTNDFTSCNDFIQYNSNIIEDEQIKANGNTYDLVSVAFLRINNEDGTVAKSSTHYVSAKKQSSGEWVLIDSKFPGETESFDNFKQLVDKYVKQCCDYELDHDKAARRFMPRFLCFTKSD